MQNLEQQLSDWDGKDTTYLKQVYQELRSSAPNNIIEILCRQTDAIPALSWLLKHHVAKKEVELAPAQKDAILSLFPLATDWSARLHCLQCLPHLVLSQQDAILLLPVVENWIESENKFVRAWSYHALGILATSIPELQSELKERFLLALEEESASVKARIRNSIKELKLDI